MGVPSSPLVSNATYYPFGPLNVLTYGNSRTLTRHYDQDYAIDYVSSSFATGLTLDLTTDVMGDVVDASDVLNAATPTRKYVYDRLYRLKQVKDGSNILQEGFAYNKSGDRTQKKLPGLVSQAYTYAPGTHRLSSVAGVARTYDSRGNTTSLPNSPYPLVYDARNRLAQAQFNGLGSFTYYNYSYNGFGERVAKTISAGTYTEKQISHYDGSGHVLYEKSQKTCGVGGGDDSLVAGAGEKLSCSESSIIEYVYMGSMPIAQVTDGTISLLESDHLATPRIAFDPTTDAQQWKWDFLGSAFGDNAAQIAAGGVDVKLRFPGQQFDSETGLHYNQFRDYEAVTGRYIESDPIGLDGGVSTYSYVNHRPLNRVDPWGLAGCSPWIAVGYGPDIFRYERKVGEWSIWELTGAFHEKLEELALLTCTWSRTRTISNRLYVDKQLKFERDCEECGEVRTEEKWDILVDKEGGPAGERQEHEQRTEPHKTLQANWWRQVGIRPEGLCKYNYNANRENDED